MKSACVPKCRPTTSTSSTKKSQSQNNAARCKTANSVLSTRSTISSLQNTTTKCKTSNLGANFISSLKRTTSASFQNTTARYKSTMSTTSAIKAKSGRPRNTLPKSKLKSTFAPPTKRPPYMRVGMSTEDNSNGNLCGAMTGTGGTTSAPGPGLLKPTSSSTEDLSEYTDADESISAPTEFLAEFLSAVMLKDYETALKYCKLILQYEPNNITAKEFYPLILEKLQNTYNNSNSSSRHYPTPSSSSSSPSASPGSSSSSASSSASSDEEDGGEGDGDADGDPEEDEEEHSGKRSSDGDATTASYSSLEDEEVGNSNRVDNVDIGNGNHIIRDSRLGGWDVKGTSTSSSAPVTTVPFGTSSDSESPTEPVSQQTIAMLRAKVVPVPPRH